MRSKLNFLIDNSFKKKVKSKWFFIANIAICIVLIAIVNIDSIISLLGGDFNDKSKIYVLDETNMMYESFDANLKTYENDLYDTKESKYEVVLADKSLDELEKLVKEDKKENNSMIIHIYNDDENNLSANLITLTKIDTYDYQLIVSALNTTSNMYILNNIGLTEEQLTKISGGLKLDRTILDETITNEDEAEEMLMTTAFPILVLPFFMLTILLVQFVGSEVNDEKSNKSMEIIISNVSPKTHFASKIISNNLFVILQTILLIIYAWLGILVRRFFGNTTAVSGIVEQVKSSIEIVKTGILKDKFVLIIVLSIILMILTFIAYSLVAGILASMTTNNEDYQQIQIPIVVVLMLGYYLSIMAGIFKGSLFIKVLAFFPFISAILSPSLLVLGQIGVIEIGISILIMVATIYLLIKYGMRVYKVGILNYSQSGMWKKMFKSLKS